MAIDGERFRSDTVTKEQLADLLLCSVRTIARAALELAQAGVLEIEHRSTAEGRQPTVYRLVANLMDKSVQGGQDCQSGQIGLPLMDKSAVKSVQAIKKEEEVKEHTSKDLAPTAQLRPRKPDPIWDAVMAVCGITTAEVPASKRGAYGRAIKELKAVGATVNDIHSRAFRYRSEFRGATLTPNGLVNQWAVLGARLPAQAAREVSGGWSF